MDYQKHIAAAIAAGTIAVAASDTIWLHVPPEPACRDEARACSAESARSVRINVRGARLLAAAESSETITLAERGACGVEEHATNAEPDARGRIQGRVFDADHKPVRGTAVSVQRVQAIAGFAQGLNESRTALTDANGEYDVAGVQAGQYYVSAVVSIGGSFTRDPRGTVPKSTTTGFGPTFYPGTTWLAYAHQVSVYPGEHVVGIDITLEKKRLARVAGKLVSASHELKDGSYASMAPARSIGRAGLSGFLGVSQVTATGDFVIDSVPPGEYVLKGRSVSLRAVQEIAAIGKSAPLTAHGDIEFSSMPVTVDGVDLTDLKLLLTPGGRIAGHVTIDEGPFRLERTYLAMRAEPKGPESLSAGVNDGSIKADGQFAIDGVTGEFVLRLAGDPNGIVLMQVKTDGRDVTDTGVAIDPNENVIVDVRLTRHPTEISGRVVTRERVEDGSCWVIVFSEESQRWSWPASRYVKAVHVGADDRFEMKGLPPGKYLAIAVRRLQGEVWRDPDYLRQLASDAKRFELREAESKSLDVPLKSTSRR